MLPLRCDVGRTNLLVRRHAPEQRDSLCQSCLALIRAKHPEVVDTTIGSTDVQRHCSILFWLCTAIHHLGGARHVVALSVYRSGDPLRSPCSLPKAGHVLSVSFSCCRTELSRARDSEHMTFKGDDSCVYSLPTVV